ncbi:MAG: molybdopterin-dependent oxidoreductase [Acidobacteriales bacterium]|nr:molybdopterin-dependent oxidoreductase [Terriglobales bacterium]
MSEVIHAACPHDCPDACGVLITVKDGRAVKVQGDPAHPVTRGFLCAKVAKYLDRVYSPDRILYPMRRVLPKGPAGQLGGEPAFERISWDVALDWIAARFHEISREFGSEAILPYSYGGTLGTLNSSCMDRRFFHRLGASQLERSICSAAGEAGLKSVLGVKLGTDPEQFRESRYIIAWASNIHGNNVHLWPFIQEARRKGAKLVVIDPYRTRTAACADWYIPINPGTDAALALAMMHVIIGEELYDKDYVSRHTLGFDELQQKVREFSPEVVSGWTGIAADDIRKLAREYATTTPAVIRVNYGVQRSEGGGMAMRAITMLPCITGSWKEVGGGLQLSTSGAFNFNQAALQRPDLMLQKLGRPARTINMVQLGIALNTLTDPPVKALFVYSSNPAAVCPNQNQVTRGLLRPDLFTVVHEQFFTDTTDYADLVLPATTFFEHSDLQAAYGHYYLQFSQQAIEPVGESRSNVEVFRSLAQRMDFDDPCFQETTDELIDQALSSKSPRLRDIDRERLQREPQVRLSFGESAESSELLPILPFAEGGFETASGKAELFSEQLQRAGLDPVVEFTPPVESRHNIEGHAYPLELLARKGDNFLNSTFCNIPSVIAMETPGILEIHPLDAAARDISDATPVRVFNARGEITLTATISDAVRPGVVSATLNWAKLSAANQNINVLTSEKLTDMGNSATFYSVLVEVGLFQPRRSRVSLDAVHCSTV